MDSLNEIWAAFCEDIKNYITEVSFNAWFKDLSLLEIGAGEVTVNVPSPQKKPILELNFAKQAEQSFYNTLGFEVKVNFVTDASSPTATASERKTFSIKSERPGDTVKFSFDNFVVGSSNRFAHAAASAIANNPSNNDYNPFFIYGPSGVGKTHLMFAIENAILEKHPDKKSIYVRGEDFTNAFITALNTHTIEEFNKKFRDVDIFLLDDIQFIAGKDVTQEALFNTIDSLYQNHRQIVLSSDRAPIDIKSLEERVRSRFECGLLTDIQPPDFETRVGIIMRKAEDVGVEITEQMAFTIAEQITRNIRQLEGIIKKLQAYTQMTGNAITFSVIHDFIKDVVNDVSIIKITPQKIIEEISRTYNISESDIISQKRSGHIIKARQAAMYIIRQMLQMTYEDIGHIFGDRDHATVLHTIKKVEGLMKMNPVEKNIIEDIIANLENIEN